MGCELHRELPAVLAFEAYKVKFKPKEALHKSLKKFWASSIKCFVKHLQAKKKKGKKHLCTFQIWKDKNGSVPKTHRYHTNFYLL